MHPAPSVIIFTTLSGLGFGLIFWIGLGQFQATGWSAFFTCAFAAGLAIVGLVASTLHLGHPERAWRALSQWRSSWLSREGVVAIAALFMFAAYAFFWVFFDIRFLLLGWLSSALAAITVFATAMIYTQLATVPRWNTAITPLKFILFALAVPALIAGIPLLAIGYLVALGITQVLHWRRGDVAMAERGHSPETATGLGRIGSTRLLEAPHSEANYLMKEMVFNVARNRARVLRLAVIVLAIIVPAIISIIALWLVTVPFQLLAVAFLSHLIGTVASRWLFFAEAQHVVSLYYGAR